MAVVPDKGHIGRGARKGREPSQVGVLWVGPYPMVAFRGLTALRKLHRQFLPGVWPGAFGDGMPRIDRVDGDRGDRPV